MVSNAARNAGLSGERGKVHEDEGGGGMAVRGKRGGMTLPHNRPKRDEPVSREEKDVGGRTHTRKGSADRASTSSDSVGSHIRQRQQSRQPSQTTDIAVEKTTASQLRDLERCAQPGPFAGPEQLTLLLLLLLLLQRVGKCPHCRTHA